MHIKMFTSFMKKRRICVGYFLRSYTFIILVTFSLGFFTGVNICNWFRNNRVFWLYNKQQYSECNQSDIDHQLFIVRHLEILLTVLEGYITPDFYLRMLRQRIISLDPQKKLAFEVANNPPNFTEVCGDIYTEEKDKPFHRKIFVTDPKCDPTKLPSLGSLVTILLLEPRSEVGDSPVANSITPLLKIYPNLQTIVATDKTIHKKAHNPETKIIYADSYDFQTPGRLWNQLVRLVTTPYVLVARDLIHIDGLESLSRLVYVLSAGSSRTLAVAGGAVRYPLGHWRAGCLQTKLRQYELRFQRDYRVSTLDCMLCDHLESPFLARANLLREIPFQDNLPAPVIFEDWFLRVKRHGYVAAACPDVLFFVNDSTLLKLNNQFLAKNMWSPLAKLWQLDHVITPNDKVLEFQCEDVGLLCDLPALHREGFLSPSCCIYEVLKALDAFDNWATDLGLDYELAEGTALGAVKLRAIMPWDIDGDIFYQLADFHTFKGKSKKKEIVGFTFTSFTITNDSKYFEMKTPNVTIDMWGLDELSTVALPEEIRNISTRVEVSNMWLRGYWNPGLAARNRYGPDYLKHAVHWRKQGSSLQTDPYKVGGWGNCSISYHPFCINRYPTDGSLNFLNNEDF